MPFKSIATLSFIALLTLPAMGAEPSDPPLFTPLPAARISPLQGKQCACVLVPAGPSNTPPPFDVVLASANAEGIRVVMNGVERVLPAAMRDERKGRWVNTYGRIDARITVSSRRVPFAPMCGRHPDPPSEGSCFVGELAGSIRSEGLSQSMPIVQLCGC